MNRSQTHRRLMHANWHYALPALVLHWLVALLTVLMAALGWYMVSIEDTPGSGWFFALHKSFGLTVLGLMLLRWLWRTSHRPGPLPASVTVLQARIAAFTHVLLYLCLFLMPLSGALGAAFSKSGLAFFGHALPRIVAPDHAMSERLFGLHGVVLWVLVALLVLHVAAGLKHLLIDRDGVFQRMWF